MDCWRRRVHEQNANRARRHHCYQQPLCTKTRHARRQDTVPWRWLFFVCTMTKYESHILSYLNHHIFFKIGSHEAHPWCWYGLLAIPIHDKFRMENFAVDITMASSSHYSLCPMSILIVTFSIVSGPTIWLKIL